MICAFIFQRKDAWMNGICAEQDFATSRGVRLSPKGKNFGSSSSMALKTIRSEKGKSRVGKLWVALQPSEYLPALRRMGQGDDFGPHGLTVMTPRCQRGNRSSILRGADVLPGNPGAGSRAAADLRPMLKAQGGHLGRGLICKKS